jgi:uncharacterized RDD family membrane protein YckC
MYTLDELRNRYSRYSDQELRSLFAAGPTALESAARQALEEEIARRGLRIDPVSLAMLPRYAKASIGSRFLAYIIDSVVGPLPALIAIGGVLVMGPRYRPGILDVGFIVASVCWGVYYSATKDGRSGGQSVGKKMLNLMVVNTATNKPCSKSQSFLRAFVWMLTNAVPLVGWLIEPIAAMASADGRRLGDRAANTQVIDARTYQPDIDSSL